MQWLGIGTWRQEELCQTKQGVQCNPHHYPVVSRESPYRCYVYSTVISTLGKSVQGGADHNTTTRGQHGAVHTHVSPWDWEPSPAFPEGTHRLTGSCRRAALRSGSSAAEADRERKCSLHSMYQEEKSVIIVNSDKLNAAVAINRFKHILIFSYHAWNVMCLALINGYICYLTWALHQLCELCPGCCSYFAVEDTRVRYENHW